VLHSQTLLDYLTTPYQGGTYAGGLIIYNPLTYVPISNPLYIDFQAELQVGHLFLGGDIRTDMNLVKSSISFSPFQETYTIDAGIRFGIFELIYSHTCYHPIMPYLTQYMYYSEMNIPIPVSEGATDSISFVIKGSLPIK
jgi:hypothetical protein